MKKLITIASLFGASLLFATAAMANGPCGVDYNGPTACGITAPANITGTFLQGPAEDSNHDYYVFWASAGTQISVTVTNEINSACAPIAGYGDYSCGYIDLSLEDSSGNDIAESSTPSRYYNGVLHSGTLITTLTDTGTYYLIAHGGASNDSNGNPHPTPYGLSVVANSGTIQWPAPPPCVIPNVYKERLATVQHQLSTNNCSLGRVYWYSRHTNGRSFYRTFKHWPHRRIFIAGRYHKATWQAGSVHPHGTRVDLLGIE